MRYILDEGNTPVGISLWYPGDGQWTDYHFIKNLQGDVLEVFKVSDGTLAASYTYDAWGNILSKSGDLAAINPFRYRSYYFDEQMWFYYLQSRYYDPAIGRFINADDVDLLGANGDFASLNLFAYCGNNPIIRTDSEGAWWHLAIGAAVGVASQYISDIVFNLATGASFSEALVPTSSVVDYLAAAGSGALAASGVGVVGSAIANAAIDGLAYAVNCGIEGEEVDNIELLLTVSASALTSGKGIDGANLRGIYRYSTEVLKTAVSPKKIGMYAAKKRNVIKTVLEEIGSSLIGAVEDGLYRDIERRLGW